MAIPLRITTIKTEFSLNYTSSQHIATSWDLVKLLNLVCSIYFTSLASISDILIEFYFLDVELAASPHAKSISKFLCFYVQYICGGKIVLTKARSKRNQYCDTQLFSKLSARKYTWGRIHHLHSVVP